MWLLPIPLEEKPSVGFLIQQSYHLFTGPHSFHIASDNFPHCMAFHTSVMLMKLNSFFPFFSQIPIVQLVSQHVRQLVNRD